MIRFETSGYALVEYEREDDEVRIVINGFWFSRKHWDQLTAELFPAAYKVDWDMWMP